MKLRMNKNLKDNMKRKHSPKTWEEWNKLLEPYFNKPKKITKKLQEDILICMVAWSKVINNRRIR